MRHPDTTTPPLLPHRHRATRDTITVSNIQQGTCSACGQELLLDAVTKDCWHPWNVEAPCPPTAFQVGGQTYHSNRPDPSYFVAADSEPHTPEEIETLPVPRHLLVTIDSLTSLVGYRHTLNLPQDIVRDLREVSAAVRKIYDPRK